MTKVCTRCGEDKPLTDYYNNRTSKDGKQHFCKGCSNAATYKWRDQNKDQWLSKNAENARHRQYRKYGITQDQYADMMYVQHGLCAICGKPESSKSRNGRRKTLAVDHNHRTGEVRRLLCHRCNTGLGGFRDDPKLLSAAIEYLNVNGV